MANADLIRTCRDEAATLLASGKVKKAAALYQRLVRLEPGSGDWARRGADCFRQLGQETEQLSLLVHAAGAYRQSGQFLKAIAMLKLAQKVDEHDPRVRTLLEQLSTPLEPAAPVRGLVMPAPRRPQTPRPTGGEAGAMKSPALETPAREAKASQPGSSGAAPAARGVEAFAPSSEAVIIEGDASLGEDEMALSSKDLVSVDPASLARLREGSLPPAPSLTELDLRERLGPSQRTLADGAPPEAEGSVIIDLDDVLIEDLTPESVHDAPQRLAEPRGPDPSVQGALEALGATELFRELDPTQLGVLVSSMEYVHLPAGHVLFEQGALADSMYVVAFGEVAALARQQDGMLLEVARLGSGQFFGEIGLLSDQPRQARIVATQDTELLCFGRRAIVDLIDSDPRFLHAVMRFLRLRLVETLMLTSPLFAPFGPEDRATLQRLFRFLEVEAGTSIVKQGEKSDGLYVMVTGQAEVSMGSGDAGRFPGTGRVLCVLGPGNVFGEMSLLQQRPAVATVRTTSRCFVLRLPDRYFMQVLMMHPALLEYVATLGATREEQNRALLAQGDGLVDDHVALF